MFAPAAIAKANAIELTFAPPQHRSAQPVPKLEDSGLIASLLRPIRRSLASNADDLDVPWIPRVFTYP